ncbi:hypothetical protein VTN49DRAFT_3202 [Thermomyces lanuginosus]|uniref:uncharacterized protein n=1 Tax=Thermomyces lanuginosus TaxID=5541 RepID=UPI0037437B94
MTAQKQTGQQQQQHTISVDHTENYWVRDPSTPARRNAAGRGLFSGLQDMKRYNVERVAPHGPGVVRPPFGFHFALSRFLCDELGIAIRVDLVICSKAPWCDWSID